jgi:hypothetical protein
MNLLPEHLVQPLAWSVALLIILLLIAGSRSHKKQKFAWLLGGLLVSYAAAIPLQWHFPLLNYLTVYIGLLAALGLVIFGVFMIFRFFLKYEVTLHPNIARDITKIEKRIKIPVPSWLYGVVGIVVGVTEPLRLQSTQHIEWFLLLTQPSFSSILSLLGYMFVAVLPVVVIGILGYFLVRIQQKHPSKFLLFGGVSSVIIGWLLFAVAGQLLHF